jgi:hypothetical protein
LLAKSVAEPALIALEPGLEFADGGMEQEFDLTIEARCD